ncbi:MAG: hypothetical protein LBH65_02420, partial [Desulfovibrio sp.]|nr:hypothetical protein [Desulfovibrio sp.]
MTHAATPPSERAPQAEPRRAAVDAALNVFAKPYQTALSVLSLLQWSGKHIDRVFIQFEPMGSMFDETPPYAVAEYLGDRAVVFQAQQWLAREAADPSRMGDPAYRLSVRYQFAFERSDKDRLFIMHNDVLIKRDFVGALLAVADGAFAVGEIGQCWNCPASRKELVMAAGLGERPCHRTRYRDFQPDFAGLQRLYAEAEKAGFFVRPWRAGWRERYVDRAWPLPECRVNEWGCLVDRAGTRQYVMPEGDVMPFGAFERCGTHNLDTAVSWFRDLNRKGLVARHLDIAPYLIHWVGTGKKDAY